MIGHTLLYVLTEALPHDINEHLWMLNVTIICRFTLFVIVNQLFRQWMLFSEGRVKRRVLTHAIRELLTHFFSRGTVAILRSKRSIIDDIVDASHLLSWVDHHRILACQEGRWPLCRYGVSDQFSFSLVEAWTKTSISARPCLACHTSLILSISNVGMIRKHFAERRSRRHFISLKLSLIPPLLS